MRKGSLSLPLAKSRVKEHDFEHSIRDDRTTHTSARLGSSIVAVAASA